MPFGLITKTLKRFKMKVIYFSQASKYSNIFFCFCCWIANTDDTIKNIGKLSKPNFLKFLPPQVILFFIFELQKIKHMKKIIFILSVSLIFSACAELQTIAEQYVNQEQPLTNQEVSLGLKDALKIGAKNAVANLSLNDGFYKNEMLKIILPPEAKTIIDHIQMIPGGNQMVEKVVLSMNRAAEDAVKEAVPIFTKAVSQMSISDAFSILRGEDDAATQYLKKTTSAQLKDLFLPKVKKSLDKKLVANISTNQSWNALATNYNKIANGIAGKIANLQPINANIEEYVTDKALDALFVKVAQEEKQIRKDPIKRVNNLLKRVFGELDK